MKRDALKYRMYGLVPYNISPIQAGIQFGHAVVEYANKYFNTPAYRRWSRKDKTFIILNGGTSNDGKRSFYGIKKQVGSMEIHAKYISKCNVKLAKFYEPNLNYMLSAFVFLLDERVWDRKKYPPFLHGKVLNGITQNYAEVLKDWDAIPFDDSRKNDLRNGYRKEYNNWLKAIGGEKNEILRHYIMQFKLV